MLYARQPPGTPSGEGGPSRSSRARATDPHFFFFSRFLESFSVREEKISSLCVCVNISVRGFENV